MPDPNLYPRVRLWPWLAAAVVVLLVILAILRPPEPGAAGIGPSADQLAASRGMGKSTSGPVAHPLRPPPTLQSDSVRTAEQIVAGKLKKFAQSRRTLAHGLAGRHGITVSGDVERFFDAVESGNWDEIERRYNAINGGDGSASTQSARPADIQQLWPAIVDAYGVAEQAHLWPAQKLLDYGNSVMDSLRPGMVYVGGTDPGRWIPELMNETGGGTPHIVVTQNGLIDDGYLDYVNLQYGDQMVPLTANDGQKALADYLADYQKRLAHDQTFPNEPAQVRPGENAGITTGDDGRLHVGGPNAQVAIMSVNELMLQALMDQNPDRSFALQQSFPFKSTYADAVPLGPLMELRATGGGSAFTPDLAAQASDYWNTTSLRLLADPEAAGSFDTLKAYAKDAVAAADLLAAHNFGAQAGEVYSSAIELIPGNPEAVFGYVGLLVGANRTADAIAVADAASRTAPDNQQLHDLANHLRSLGTN